MNIAPKAEGETIPFNGRMPENLDEAVAYINSKFLFIADSVVAYEEFSATDGSIIRATHVTYAFSMKVEGQHSFEELAQLWAFAMLDAVSNSKRQRLYWRMKPQMKLTEREFPDGRAFAIEIISRSSMV